MTKYLKLLIALLLGAVLFSSFQCASKEMTSGKMKYSSQNYEEAVDYFKKELSLNPTNQEAITLLVDSYMRMKQWENAADVIAERGEDVTNPQFKQNISIFTNQLWVNAYNEGIRHFNDYLSTQQDIHLDSAISSFQLGAKVRPRMVDFYDFLGRVYDAKGDAKNMIKYYDKYLDLLEPELTFMKENGLYLYQDRSEILEKLGEPTKTAGLKMGEDSTLTDLFKKNEVDTYIFTVQNGNEFELVGIRHDPPKNWDMREQSQFTQFRLGPLTNLIQVYYEQEEYEKSLEYVKILTQVDPNNSEANASLITLYQQLGKEDEAISQVRELTEQYPSNKTYWARFGDIYSNMEEFDKAIEKYEKALTIDPMYAIVLRNAASAYKNKAGIEQKKQQEEIDAGDREEIDIDEYKPYLEKSEEYFAKSLQTNEFKNDYMVLSELANIYTVLEDEQQLRDVIKKLESIEYEIPNDRKESYYLKLIRIYSELGESDKTKEIQRKLESLGN